MPGRRRLRAAARAARSSTRRSRRPPHPGRVQRADNGGIVAASNDALAMARGEFVALLDHDDDAAPRRPRPGRRGDRHRPRGRLRLHRRGQDRPRRAPLRPVLQARLVAGADAHADVHLPPQRPATLAGRRGRRLRPRVRGLPGLGPGAAGDRAGPRGASTSRASSTTGACSRPRPQAAARGEAVGLRSRQAGGTGSLRPDRPARRGRARHRAIPASSTCSPGSEREPLVSIVIPTAGSAREVRYEHVVLVEHCVRSVVERSTYENYEIVCVVGDSVEPEVLARAAGDRRRAGCASSTSSGPSTSRPRSTGRGPQRGRAPAAAQRRHRGRRPRTGSSAW